MTYVLSYDICIIIYCICKYISIYYNYIQYLKFAGHCLHRDDEDVSDLDLWEPTHGTRRRRRPPESYIRNLERETGIPASEMKVAMMNRDVWITFTDGKKTILK